MVKLATKEAEAPAAEPGTEIRVEGRELVAYGTGFGYGGRRIDPKQVLVLESLRDKYGYRTVLHLADRTLVVVAESAGTVGRKLDEVRSA